jgi:hypothetical protein
MYLKEAIEFTKSLTHEEFNELKRLKGVTESETENDMSGFIPILPKDKTYEYILCSAIWLQDGIVRTHQPNNIDDGIVFCGHRHHNCIVQIKEMQLTSSHTPIVQGFLTSKNRFVDRIEGGKIAFEVGQVDKPTDTLMSEDLW